MRKTKKNPKVNLENYSKLFLQLGLVLALFITYVAIENKTHDREYDILRTASMNADDDEDTPITERPEPVTPKTLPPPAPEKIEVVEDEEEVVETVIESTETDETEEIIIEEEEEDEEIIEDVSFIIIEDVPVFPGCKGDKAALKKCFNQKVQKHFHRKFDTELPNELGLSPGKKRINIMFKIDKNGNVMNIQARAPHPKIKKEVIKVMKLLPKMKPGRQRGVPVGVKYSIPFSLIVE